MSTLSKAKVAYLPEATGTHTLLTFPNPRTSRPQNLLLHKEQLYELLLVSSATPHLSSQHQPPTTKKDDKPVRSLILENLTDGTEGLILEDSDFIISSAFSVEFSLIWWFKHDQKKQLGRFQTLDDLVDNIEQDIPNITNLPLDLISKGLGKFCEILNENDEVFYKFSDEKLIGYLKTKIQKISDNFPATILEKLIKPTLFPVDITSAIPDDVLELSKTQYSIHLLSSYLLPSVQRDLTEEYDLTKLDQYLKQLKEARIKKKLVEDSVNDLNQLNSANKRKPAAANGNGPAKKKQAIVKKPIKVQKGTLDTFFGLKKK